MGEKEMTFWDHLDELKKVLFRIIVVVIAFSVVTFSCKELLFKIVLAPHRSDFVLYRLLGLLADSLSMPSLRPEEFHVDLISTQLTSQFVIHLSTAFYAALLLASPYIIYQLFRFVSPALYENERKYSTRVLVSAFVLFFTGVLLNYYLIFPLSFRFLATYQVAEEVTNIITLSSYMGSLLMLSLMMGIMFEIPVLSWLFAKLELITSGYMKRYRKHAIVLVLIIAAIITPTTDVFTLTIVTIPIYLLYEFSIFIVKRSEKKLSLYPENKN